MWAHGPSPSLDFSAYYVLSSYGAYVDLEKRQHFVASVLSSVGKQE
jgi:hypothetical protein